MQKIDGVQTVQVSLKAGTTTLELRPDNTVTLAQLRTVIRNNGFVSRDAKVVARGTLTGNVVEVSGSREQLRASAAPTRGDGGAWHLTVPAVARR